MPLGNVVYANNFSTTIAGSATSTTTGSKQVTSTTGLPAVGIFYLLCESEIIIGSVVDGTHINFLVRGAESTTAADHATTTAITQIVTAESLLLTRGPRTDRVVIEDDFIFGLDSSVTGGKGQASWSVTGGAGMTFRDGESGHPGIARLTTSASANSAVTINAHGGGNDGSILPSDTFDMTWIVRLGTSNSNTLCQAGLRRDANVSVATRSANGIYLEKQSADTNWFGVCRASSTETRVDTSAATGTGWASLRLRRIDASTIGFSVNGGTEVTITANIPSAALQPSGVVETVDAVARTIDLDYVNLLLTGLSR